MSGPRALARILLCKPMQSNDLFAALEHIGGFTVRRSARKQSHFMVRGIVRDEPFILPVGHDGEVSGYWVRKLIRHFGLDEAAGSEGDNE